MSTYQYYEFQTIDRLLTATEQAEVENLSSHIEVSASRAVVTYSYGSFRHDPKQVLSRYFDACLYVTNWGTRRLMFRFPEGLMDLPAVEPYCIEGVIEFTRLGAYQILEIEMDEEEGFGWAEAEGVLSGLIQLRNDILERDYRGLYLAWLKAVTLADPKDVADEQEPPVPAGLQQLTPALQRLAQFLDIDSYLIASAATNSSAKTSIVSDQALQQAIARLTREECDEFLFRLAQGEAQLGLTLKHKLHGMLKTSVIPEASHRRTVHQISIVARQLEQEAEQQRAAEAEKRRIEELKALAKREAQVWQMVETLIQNYKPKAYDEAVDHLLKLRELAEFQNTLSDFTERVRQLRAQYRSRSSFIKRLDRVKPS
ncbi:MAG: hypothetical protein HY232_12305 [Acidobacteria bacterium]|nr:hypothetical protein [Acidobacteriota bacterium]